MGNYNFVTDLQLREKPHSKFVDTLLWLFKKDLDEAYDTRDMFALANVFQQMLYHTTTTISPETHDDKAIYETIGTLYFNAVEELRKIKDPDPLACSALAVHKYFSEKIKQYIAHKDWLTKYKLSLSNDLQNIILKRQLGATQPDFKTKINYVIARHISECKRQNTQEGKFGLLAQLVRDDHIETQNMPKLHQLITHINVSGIQAHFIAEKDKLRFYELAKKRWLNQLSQPKTNAVEYYQGWAQNNPYQHAKKMALRQTCIYTFLVIIAAIIINLAVAASTAGIGNLIAMSAALAHVSSTPGAYALIIGLTGCTTAGISYSYHRKQYQFKQQAIQSSLPLLDELVASQPPNKINGLDA